MRLPAGISAGAATHTGRVRTHNEDDHLLGALLDADPPLLLAAVADGMGGVAGGAEASRLALQAFGSAVLDGGSAAPIELRCRAGCEAAARRIAEQAEVTPALRGMGTTLLACVLQGPQLQVVHVGDSRLYRWRGGALQRLTTDHAVREPDNRLLRCVGGGSRSCVPDLLAEAAVAGDRLLLCTDGVWASVPEPELTTRLAAGPPQAAAEALVAAALAHGGPDNATAVVLEIGPAVGEGVECELPREERPGFRADWPPARSLRAPWWPWLLLAAAAGGAVAWLVRWL